MSKNPLIKFSATEDWNWDVAPVQLICNSNTLTKAGADSSELKVTKTAGQTDALVIALGAYEGTGANRNGDFFKEAECIKHYKTFVKSGSRRPDGSYDGRALNRHHKNKPTDPKYGNIKAATYNHGMKRIELVIGMDNDKCAEEIQKLAEGKQINVSMAAKVGHDTCFVAGTLIETATGMSPIEQLATGDQVYCHDGLINTVVDARVRVHAGDFVRITASSVPHALVSTADHPYYALSHEKVHRGCRNGDRLRRVDKATVDFTPDWVAAKDLRPNDYLLYPVVVSDETLELGDLAYVLGLYLGAGTVVCKRGKPVALSWTFDEKDPEIVEKLRSICPKLSVYPVEERRCFVATLYDREVVAAALHYCGRYTESKRIHPTILKNGSAATRKAFAAGFVDSDGSVDSKKGCARVGGINPSVLGSYRSLLLSLGEPCGWQSSTRSDYYTGAPRPGEYIYSVHLGCAGTQLLLGKDSVKVKKYGRPARRPLRKSMILSGYLLLPIASAETHTGEHAVYNLQVANSSSYIANGVAVHNCSWCGHKAKTDADRCEHIPAKLGEVNKRGEMCSMDNVKPHWFELSIVGRPADRIGMSLKLASAYVVKTAADYRELYPGFVAPVDDILSISKYAAEKRTLVSKLAAIEKRIEGIIEGGPKSSADKYLVDHKAKIRESEDISDSAMEELRKHEPSKLLRVLADHGIIFSPADFLKYLFGKTEANKLLGDKMRSRLPSIFSDLDDDGDDVVNEEKYEPSHSDSTPKNMLNLVRGLFDGHSLFDAPAHGRVMRITIMRGGPAAKIKGKVDEKEMAKEAAVCELSRQYASYKLAALRHMASQHKLDEDTIVNALLQNR